MSEPQTSSEVLLEYTKVSSGDNVANVDEIEQNLEKELFDETQEPSAADVYLLLQEMHTDMRSFKSRLDRVEKGQSNDNTEADNEVVSDQKLASKHGHMAVVVTH